MDALRKEIDDEIKRTRLDKTRLYELLVKIIDQCGGPAGEGSVGPAGPVGPVGPAGPAGPAGPVGVCKCKCTCTKEDKPSAKPAAKKTVTTTKKKTTASST